MTKKGRRQTSKQIIRKLDEGHRRIGATPLGIHDTWMSDGQAARSEGGHVAIDPGEHPHVAVRRRTALGRSRAARPRLGAGPNFFADAGLPLARQLGLTRALVTCDEDNIGSRKIIEACGGVYEDSYTEGLDVPRRRYRIEPGR